MQWHEIETVFASPDMLTLFSLDGLPGGSNSISQSPMTSLIPLSFAKNVGVKSTPDADLISYYKDWEMAPECILSVNEVPTKNATQLSEKKISKLIAMVQSKEVRNILGATSLPFAFGSEKSLSHMNTVLARSFLLLKHGEKVNALKSISVDSLNEDVSTIWKELNVFGSGVVFREDFSIHGDQFNVATTFERFQELVKDSKGKSRIIVPLVPGREVAADLEVSFSTGPETATLLGVVEQIIHDHRHVGSRSVELSSSAIEQIEKVIQTLNPILNELGFSDSIFGLDGFLLRSAEGNRYTPYDLNPCISQAFFPLFPFNLLRKKLPKFKYFQFHLYSITRGVSFGDLEQCLLKKEKQDAKYGVFPVLFHTFNSDDPKYSRTIMMALFVAKEKEALPESVKFFENEISKTRKVYQMFF